MKGLWLLLIMLASVCTALAEVSESQPKVIRCSFIHWDGVPDKGFYFRMGVEFLPVEFEKADRGKSISLRRMNKIEVFHKSEGAPEGQLPYKLVADAVIPNHMSDIVFLILSPDEDTGEGYRVIVIDDSIEAFPPSSCLFVNLCPQVFTVDFAGVTEELKPNHVRALFSKVSEKGGFVPCIISGEDGERVFENRFFSQRSTRRLVFLRPNITPDLKTPRIKFLSQYLVVGHN